MAENRPSLDDIFGGDKPSLDAIFAEPQAPVRINIGKQPEGPVGTAIKGLAQGMTGNMADEIDAFLTSKGLNPFSDQIPYDEKLAYNRQNDKADAAANPISDLAGQVGGTVLDTAALGGLFPNLIKGAAAFASKGILPAAAVNAGAGAVSGAIYGAGGSEGDRAAAAADGGAVGGMLGPVGAVAARPIGALTERALKLVSKYRPTIEKATETVEGAITRSPIAKPL